MSGEKEGDKSRTRAKSRSPRPSTAKKQKRNTRPPRSARQKQLISSKRTYTKQGGLSVTVNLPPLKLPARLPLVELGNRYREKFSWRIALMLTVAFPIVIVIGLHGRPHHTKATAPSGASVRTTPDFKPLMPAKDAVSQKSYDGRRNLVSYTTSFSGARLTVSEQHLPTRFLSDPNATQAAADSIQAKQRIETGKGPLYIASNEQRGDQMAIFAGKEVLLFIHSDRKLDDISWKSFIELLEVKTL